MVTSYFELAYLLPEIDRVEYILLQIACNRKLVMLLIRGLNGRASNNERF